MTPMEDGTSEDYSLNMSSDNFLRYAGVLGNWLGRWPATIMVDGRYIANPPEPAAAEPPLTEPPSPVPLPLSGVMLLAALSTLGVLKQRRALRA
jgi:hypothetical protein